MRFGEVLTYRVSHTKYLVAILVAQRMYSERSGWSDREFPRSGDLTAVTPHLATPTSTQPLRPRRIGHRSNSTTIPQICLDVVAMVELIMTLCPRLASVRNARAPTTESLSDNYEGYRSRFDGIRQQNLPELFSIMGWAAKWGALTPLLHSGGCR